MLQKMMVMVVRMDIIVLDAIYSYYSNLGYNMGHVSVYSLSGNSGSGYQ